MSFSPYRRSCHDDLMGFDTDAYLRDREAREQFVIAEIGHGEAPVALRQKNLTGQRAYVGIENWLREPEDGVQNTLIKLHRQLFGKNVGFIRQSSPGKPIFSGTTKLVVTFENGYDPTTILPDDAADEVVLSNVFGDPEIQCQSGATQKLLNEAGRLLAPDGSVIIRETITPNADVISRKRIECAGLHAVGYIPRDMLGWDDMEAVFRGLPDNQGYIRPSSFYLILAHCNS